MSCSFPVWLNQQCVYLQHVLIVHLQNKKSSSTRQALLTFCPPPAHNCCFPATVADTVITHCVLLFCQSTSPPTPSLFWPYPIPPILLHNPSLLELQCDVITEGLTRRSVDLTHSDSWQSGLFLCLCFRCLCIVSVFISKVNKNPFILPSGPSDLIACETACKQCDNVVMKERLFISEVEYHVLSELSPVSDVKATCEQ